MSRKSKNTNKRVVDKKDEKKQEQEVNQTGHQKIDEDGYVVEQNVFPPIDENTEFNGTAAAQRIIRQSKEQNEKKD